MQERTLKQRLYYGKRYNIPKSFNNYEPHLIYCITNKLNGKQYIGITKNSLKVRWSTHKTGSSGIYLSRSIKKYGKDNFEIKVIDMCDCRHQANILEKHYIKRLNTLTPNGYNITTGGDGVSGIKQSKAQIEKRIQSTKNTIQLKRVKSTPLQQRLDEIVQMSKDNKQLRQRITKLNKDYCQYNRVSKKLDIIEKKWSLRVKQGKKCDSWQRKATDMLIKWYSLIPHYTTPQYRRKLGVQYRLMEKRIDKKIEEIRQDINLY